MPIVYSTLTNDSTYCDYDNSNGKGGIPTIKKQVVIKGGANRADKRLITPLGVPTEISDSDLEWLKTKKNFQIGIKEGFITVRDKVDIEVAVADMNKRDESAPAVAQDFGDEDASGKLKRFANLRIRNKIE